MFKKASVIIASRNEGEMLRQTIDFIKRAPVNIPYEIIAVDDGSEDGSFDWLAASRDPLIRGVKTSGQGCGYARNRGADIASGDMLVFCDAHIDAEPYWLDKLAQTLEDYRADAVTPAFYDLTVNDADRKEPRFGCGMTLSRLTQAEWLYGRTGPFETPILCGACWAVRREAFRDIGGYEEAFRGCGGDDAEISLKLWLNGYTVYAAPSVHIAHRFRRRAPYPVSWADVMYNEMYIALCHYNDERVKRLLAKQAIFLNSDKDYAEVFTPENIRKVRLPKFERRKRSDDWFFTHFGMDL
ncbi:MAG: glycosyltransferase [Clostridiales bacterium]|jgi:glycosyltransferase involved in cell wall biosynthesis|nr:glycosyltransferase [Clostridiales bacterium]